VGYSVIRRTLRLYNTRIDPRFLFLGSSGDSVSFRLLKSMGGRGKDKALAVKRVDADEEQPPPFTESEQVEGVYYAATR